MYLTKSNRRQNEKNNSANPAPKGRAKERLIVHVGLAFYGKFRQQIAKSLEAARIDDCQDPGRAKENRGKLGHGEWIMYSHISGY